MDRNQSDSDGIDPAGLAAAQIVAWLSMGLVNVVSGALAIPLARSGVGGRLLLHLYDLGQMLALGLVAAAMVLGWRRWVRRGRLASYLALSLLAVALSQLLLPTDLRGASRILGLEAWQYWSRVFAALFSLCIPTAAWLGQRLSRGRLRLAVVLAGLVLALAHQLVLPNLYLGIHTFGTWCAATLVATATAPSLGRPLTYLRGRGRPWRLTAATVVGLAAFAALLVPAPASVLSQLRMVPGAVVARYKPELPVGGAAGAVPQDQADWYRDRSQLAAIPPSPSRLLPSDAIVIFVLVDALRADVINGPDVAKLPTMADLKARGANFTQVWSPAPNTNPAVAALHACKYPAQLHWKLEAVGKHPRLWPDDPSPRLGDLLAQAKIESALVVSTPMAGLKPRYGLTQGLSIEIEAPNQYSRVVVPAFLRWLDQHDSGPLLAYIHVTDAHAPYNLGKKGGSKRDGYVAEIGLIDRSLEQLLEGLRSRGLDDRAVVILTADHGEAFGEHNSWYHGTTVYEEMVRVPLIVVGKDIQPRSIPEKVTTLDLVPTILDLYGLATPASCMGQSLVPLLGGQDVHLTRPIFLDSHAGASGMVFADGTKLVVRDGVPELYDLRVDPGELENIYDTHPAAAEKLGAYRRFVAVHRMKLEKQ